MAITKEHVFKAADALVEMGEEPTNAAVRDQLGSGSFKTITPFLKEWREIQEQSADVPNDLANSMENTLRQVWMQAKETAKLAFIGERNILEAQLAEMEDELRLRDEMAEELNQKIADLNETVTQGIKFNETLKKQTDERIAELKEAKASNVADLRKQVDEARTETKEARAEAKEAAKSERELNKQLVTLTTQIAEAKNAAEKAQAEAKEAKAAATKKGNA